MDLSTKFEAFSVEGRRIRPLYPCYPSKATFRRPNLQDDSKVLDVFPILVLQSLKPDKDDKFFRPKNLTDEFHVIARGTYADIIAAKMRRKGRDEGAVSVAIRRYSMAKLSSTVDGYRRVKREVDIARLNRHENIVIFYGTWLECPNGPTEYFCNITERMDHTLEKYFEHLRKKDRCELPMRRDIRHIAAMLAQLLQALEFLHSNGIIHRDITPRNIGMNQKDFAIKLLDFGLARDILSNNDYTINVDTPPIYKAPEALVQEKYDTGVDIWAAALVTIEMLGLKLMMPPNLDPSSKSASVDSVLKRMRNIRAGQEIERLSELWEDKTGQRDRSKIILDSNQSFEKVFEDALEPRIGDNIGPLTKSDLLDLLTQMPTVDKIQRPTASELLGHAFLRIIDRKLRGRATRAVNTPEAENASAYAELTNTETFRWNPDIEL